MFDLALKNFLHDIGRDDLYINNLTEQEKYLIVREISTMVYFMSTGDFNIVANRNTRNLNLIEEVGSEK